MTIVKDFIYLILVFVFVWIAFYLGTRNATLEEKMARYDCTLAEFSPDFPPEIRQECRRRALERINQQKDM
jgi:hypothetical protein